MEVAYTGTQNGMSFSQKSAVRKLLLELGPKRVHHGDCVGGDAEFHQVARLLHLYVVRHPPIERGKRAFCDYDEDREPEEYLERNHTLVDESDVLIGAPRTAQEITRSGTWATIRYARAQHKTVFIVSPIGKVTIEEGTLPW